MSAIVMSGGKIIGSGGRVVSQPSGGGGGTLGAPQNLQLTHQTTNTQTITWNALAGATVYKIYRNGALYDTTAATTYTDAAATNSCMITNGLNPYGFAATPYFYWVSGVNGTGEGQIQKQLIFWAYNSGTYRWEGDFSNFTPNYADTTGLPNPNTPGSTADILIIPPSLNSFWQPFSGTPSTPEWAMEMGGFNLNGGGLSDGFALIDLKPSVSGQTWQWNTISRVTPGDVFNTAPVQLPVSGGVRYGPDAVANVWASYKVPFSVLMNGFGTFMGTISGTNLTVVSNLSGIKVEAGAFISCPGNPSLIPSGTFTNNTGTGSGGPGTVIGLNNSLTIATSTLMQIQRTNNYKISLLNTLSSAPTAQYWVDNFGFSYQ